MGRRGRPAVLTPKERAEHRKQTLKKYRESHKEEIKQYMNDYCLKNREQLRKYRKRSNLEIQERITKLKNIDFKVYSKEEVKTEIFALYKGDDFVDIGTLKELSVKYDINYHYLRRLLRPSIRKYQAVTQRSRGYILIEA